MVLDVLVQSRPDKQAAKQLLRKLLIEKMSSVPQLNETSRKRTVSADGMHDDDRNDGCRGAWPRRADVAAAQAGCGASAAPGRGPEGGFAGAGCHGRDAERLGEMLLERELLEAKVAALEGGRPLARRRSRP